MTSAALAERTELVVK